MSEVFTLGELAGLGLDEMGGGAPADELHRLRLQQQKSRGGGRPGTIVNAVTLESFPEVKNAVALRMSPQRQRWRNDDDGGFDGESRLACCSDDRKVPAPTIKSPFATECADCPEAQWQTIDGRRRPPRCHEVAATIIAVGPERRPYRLDFRGASFDAAKTWSQWARNNAGNLLCAAVDIGVETHQSKSGLAYYSLVVSTFRLIEEAEAAAITTVFQLYKDYDLTASRGGREG